MTVFVLAILKREELFQIQYWSWKKQHYMKTGKGYVSLMVSLPLLIFASHPPWVSPHPRTSFLAYSYLEPMLFYTKAFYQQAKQ